MEAMTSENGNGVSAQPTGVSEQPTGVSAAPIDVRDTPIPPHIAEICNRTGLSEEKKREMALLMTELHSTPHKFDWGKPKPKHIPPGAAYVCVEKDSAEAVSLGRKSRKYECEAFTSQYVYDTNNMELRHCVWNDDSCFLSEKSSGIIWVAMHGADSICVVTSNGVLDEKRLGGRLKYIPVHFLRSYFRKSIICEIEDLADPCSELRKSIQKDIKKPFGVVSANPGTDNIHKESGCEASNVEYDENKAIEFLQEKMKCHTNFSVIETIKTAIYAFQHLFRKRLNASEIEVSVMDPKYFGTVKVSERYKDATVQQLPVHEIKEYLDAFVEMDNPVEMDNLAKPTNKAKKELVSGVSSNISETNGVEY